RICHLLRSCGEIGFRALDLVVELIGLETSSGQLGDRVDAVPASKVALPLLTGGVACRVARSNSGLHDRLDVPDLQLTGLEGDLDRQPQSQRCEPLQVLGSPDAEVIGEGYP